MGGRTTLPRLCWFRATVEAPADEFQTMRDRCDLERLLALPDVAPLVKLPLTVGNVKALAAKTKLSRVGLTPFLRGACRRVTR